MDASHWSGCDTSAVSTDEYGHRYCTCCGRIIHHAHPVEASNEGSKCGTIIGNNEGRVSAANAPSPLDANKERRNG